MTILDSNVVSELMFARPSPVVVDWLHARGSDLWTTAVTIFEVRHGLALLPAGRKRRELTAAFETALRTVLHGRVLLLDEASATEAASIFARVSTIGRPMDIRDVLIAGTVAAHPGGVVATRNVRHFADAAIPLLDPWAAGPP